MPEFPFTPTVRDVADIMNTRDLQTRSELVKTLIVTAQGLMLPHLGRVTPSLSDAARSIIALQTAMLVEITLWPEETESENAPFARYERMLTAALSGYVSDRDGNNDPSVPRTGSIRMRTFYTQRRLHVTD